MTTLRHTRRLAPATPSADARRVVANPEQYAGQPLLRRLAWAALMAGRGRRVDQGRLAQMPVEMPGGRDV